MKELLYLKDEQIKEFIEKLFLTYRETFSDSKIVLNKYSLGIAHIQQTYSKPTANIQKSTH